MKFANNIIMRQTRLLSAYSCRAAGFRGYKFNVNDLGKL